LTTTVSYKYRIRNAGNTDWATTWTPSTNTSFTTYTSTWTGTNTGLLITNQYQPLNISLKAVKNTQGANMVANQFSFGLYEIDENDEIDENSSITAKNSSVGISSPVTFTLPTYTKVGTYVYYLTEEGIDLGWKMDTTRYRIEVRVFLKTNGTLDSEIKYIEANNNGQQISGKSYIVHNSANDLLCPRFTNVFGGPKFPHVGGIGETPFVTTSIILTILIFIAGILVYVGCRCKKA